MKRISIISALLGLLLAGIANAAQPLQVKPGVYDPDHTGIISAGWVPSIGLPDSTGKANHGLLLQKNGPTPTNAAAFAEITFQGTITELGFDIRNDTHCGAGAPRFNVETQAGILFFGCAAGTHSPAPQDPVNWTRIRIPEAVGINAKSIAIVFDEGTDTGPDFTGKAIMDNIDINGTLVGKPGAAK